MCQGFEYTLVPVHIGVAVGIMNGCRESISDPLLKMISEALTGNATEGVDGMFLGSAADIAAVFTVEKQPVPTVIQLVNWLCDSSLAMCGDKAEAATRLMDYKAEWSNDTRRFTSLSNVSMDRIQPFFDKQVAAGVEALSDPESGHPLREFYAKIQNAHQSKKN